MPFISLPRRGTPGDGTRGLADASESRDRVLRWRGRVVSTHGHEQVVRTDDRHLHVSQLQDLLWRRMGQVRLRIPAQGVAGRWKD
jgi:hypothetical protein